MPSGNLANMASTLLSPCGVLSDEEECGPVLESTAADLGGLLHPQPPLPEISLISPAVEPCTPARKVCLTGTTAQHKRREIGMSAPEMVSA